MKPLILNERGIAQQNRNIARSKLKVIELRYEKSEVPFEVTLGGDNFEFVSFTELPELKLWERP